MDDELEAMAQLIERQGQLLTGIANAIKGDPDALSSHSHHDLPDRAAAVMGLVGLQQIRIAELEAENALMRGFVKNSKD